MLEMDEFVSLVNGGRNTRGLVVDILGSEWPLNGRQVFAKVRSGYAKDITYQGIHKVLHQLSDEGVVVKSDDGYSLNEAWVSELHSFSERLFAKHVKKQPAPLENLGPGESATISLNCPFIDAFNVLLGQTEQLVVNSKTRKPMISHSRHSWPMTVVSDKQYAQLKQVAKKKHFILCSGDSVLDKFLLEFWRKRLNAQWRFDPGAAQNCDLVVVDDFVVQIFFSPSFSKKWHETCLAVKRKEDVDLSQLYKNVFETRSEISLVATRNDKIAEQLRAQTLAHFRQ